MSLEWLGETFCLTAVLGLPAGEALVRSGALAPPALMTREEALSRARDFDAGYPRLCLAAQHAAGVLLLEAASAELERAEVLRALSKGTAALSVSRTPESCMVSLAEDGVLVAGVDAARPYLRWGADPGRLSLEGEGADAAFGLLAAFTPEAGHAAARFAGQVPGAALVALLDDPPAPAVHPLRLRDPELASRLDRAPAGVLRAVALGQACWCTEQAGVAGEPQVVAALAGGVPRRVSDHEPLGLRIRAWNEEGHVAGASLADPLGRERMPQERRRLAFLRAAAGSAVRAALFDDPLAAAFGTLAGELTEERRAEVLRQMN
ncbi:hypothetical protein [Streptomyces sp. NPDC091371]|uniref:hypothetical protein n=1 Tax=Streptomyces sp. NPDC091371 TaxID=3155303 RepID=UPI003427B2BD